MADDTCPDCGGRYRPLQGPWLRLLLASEYGRGIRLSADEVVRLMSDEATVKRAELDRSWCERCGDAG